MASFKKTLAEKIFRISKTSNQSLTNCRISTSSCSVKTRIPRNPSKTNAVTDPSDNGIFRRLLHRKANSTTESSEIRSMLVRDNMMEMLRVIDVAKDRVRLDGLVPPEKVGKKATEEEGLTVEDARKLLKVAQLEVVKSRLREMEKTWISYSEFVRVCGEACSDPEQGVRFARMLDESGSVIVIGSMVLLKPDQVVKAIGGLIPLPATNWNDPRMKELKEMEKSKAEIDRKADALVRRELWAGLGFFVVQTAGLMRLTFWELTWDVMEPICFYLSTIYCMAGYTFFLRTAKEPTFEGIYKSRLNAKQKGLMKLHNFDLERYNELRKIYYPYSSFSSSTAATSSSVVPALNQAN